MLDTKMLTFLKVVECKSYTVAAQALHLTQPAVTQHIKKLEEHYHCKLIDFSGRSMQLTQAGKLVYHYVNLQLCNEYLLINQLQDVINPLRMGATLSIADYYLPKILTAYLIGEQCGFGLTVGNTQSLMQNLIHGQLDCALIEGIFDQNLFESHVFRRARFLPVASANHPLAGKRAAWESLHAYPLVLREPGSGTRAILENELYQKNDSVYAFQRTMELGNFIMIKQFVQASDAISFMYEAVALEEVRAGKLCFLDVEDYSVTRPLHYVYLKNSIMKERYQTFFHKIMQEEDAFLTIV